MTAKAPGGLSNTARKLWRGITTEYDLRVDELRLLEDACREMDLIDEMQRLLAGSSERFEVEGSQGQTVAGPLVQEIRQHRALLKQLLGALKLTEAEGASAPAERASKAREAAMARWHGA